MRILVVLALSLGACSANSHYSDPRLVSNIDKTYRARDACLARNAVPYVKGDTDATNIARAVSLSCQTETDKLISLSNPTRDPAIAAAIRRDTESRAMGFVLKARGEVIPY